MYLSRVTRMVTIDDDAVYVL